MEQEEKKHKRFIELLEKHSPEDGTHFSNIEGFGTIRESISHKRKPVLYPPGIIFVGQGRKYCYVADKRYDYSAGNLLTLIFPMPVETEIIEASSERPFLAAGLMVNMGRIANLLLKIETADDSALKPVSADPSGIFTTPLTGRLLDPIIRLFEAVESPRDAAVLGQSIIDEIYYRILCEDRGGELRLLLQERGEIQRISRAVEYIHQNLEKPVSIEALAEMVHMSRTTFYERFKEVMHVSPLQYAKSVKLHRAQTLIQEGKKGNEAGYLVGYNSPAQFSREYKRHFGFAPSAT